MVVVFPESMWAEIPMLRMCDNALRSASVTSLSVLCALVRDRSNADCGRGLTHPCQPLHAAASACCRPLRHAYAGKLPVAAASILSSLHAASSDVQRTRHSACAANSALVAAIHHAMVWVEFVAAQLTGNQLCRRLSMAQLER